MFTHQRIHIIAAELAAITHREHGGDLVALVREYIHEAQQAGVLPVRASGELTAADLDLLYEFLQYQVILASYASGNQARDIYAEAHGHVARAATAATPDKVHMHLRLAGTAIEMLALGVRQAEADEARQAEDLAAMAVASEVRQ